MTHIEWHDFQKIELRVGTIVEVSDFPEAKNPAFILKIDFGGDIGIKKSSAQITDLYTADKLLGKASYRCCKFPSQTNWPTHVRVFNYWIPP